VVIAGFCISFIVIREFAGIADFTVVAFSVIFAGICVFLVLCFVAPEIFGARDE
jgi:Na+-translocating ferredoxin:NAD+ oxidoreductase RnfD subunit